MTTSCIRWSLLLLTVVPNFLWNLPSNSLLSTEYQLDLQSVDFNTCPPEQVLSSSSCRSYLQVKFTPIVYNFRSHIVSRLFAHAATYSASTILSATHDFFMYLIEPPTPYYSTHIPLELTVPSPSQALNINWIFNLLTSSLVLQNKSHHPLLVGITYKSKFSPIVNTL
jgi:hypothetical protein